MSLASDAASQKQRIRATQTIVAHMGFCWGHPSLLSIEIAWRWLFGVPLLWILWQQADRILTQLPFQSVGLDRVELQNPWLSAILISEALARYEPLVASRLPWLLPGVILGWAIISGFGRVLLLARMRKLEGYPKPAAAILRKLPSYVALQGLWALALLTCVWLWYEAMGLAAAKYITSGGQPDLVGYLCWLIFLSLGIYTLWALVSWTLFMAPLLLVLAGVGGSKNAISVLATSFRLGRVRSSKLLEVNLVLAIVTIMLIVLDMVFSAAPLPFADQFGPDALHVLYVVIFLGFLIAKDYFQVVRLRAFTQLWRFYQAR